MKKLTPVMIFLFLILMLFTTGAHVESNVEAQIAEEVMAGGAYKKITDCHILFAESLVGEKIATKYSLEELMILAEKANCPPRKVQCMMLLHYALDQLGVPSDILTLSKTSDVKLLSIAFTHVKPEYNKLSRKEKKALSNRWKAFYESHKYDQIYPGVDINAL